MKSNSKKEITNVEKKQKILNYSFYLIVSAIVFVLSFRIFCGKPVYDLDLELHIKSAFEGGAYSISLLFLKYSYMLTGSKVGCAVYLSAISVLTLFALAYFFKTCMELSNKRIDFSRAFIIAAPLCFLGEIYIPKFHEYFYWKTYFAQPWHNSTYLLMRLFGLITVACYLKIRKKYLESGISVKEWLTFFVLLTLTNSAKPNFFIFFAPAMLCDLIYDFIKTRAKELKRIVVFGSAVLCSMPVLFYQLFVLYNPEETEKSEVIVSVSRYFQSLSPRIITQHLITSLLFVLAVSIICVIKKCVSRELISIWLMFCFAYIERSFLYETGYRETHGNFGWGLVFAGLLLTAICLERLMYMKEVMPKSLYIALHIVLWTMVLCGMFYFVILVVGGSVLL